MPREWSDTYRAYTDAHHDRLLESYVGIDDALGTLHGAGVQLAVVTSKTHALARRGLKGCGLDGYFGVLIGADDVSQHKPHPAPVLAALDRLSAVRADTVFIGDSPHDIEAGRAAGIRTAAALWGPFPARCWRRRRRITGSPRRTASPLSLGDGVPSRSVIYDYHGDGSCRPVLGALSRAELEGQPAYGCPRPTSYASRAWYCSCALNSMANPDPFHIAALKS